MPVISTNTAANTAVRYLNMNSLDQSDSLAKLASGSRINKASDDAAGLAIATKISSDVAALDQAATNSSHGISVLRTADGGAANVADILERMKTLASQSASGTVTDTERAYVQAEFDQLKQEIDGIAKSTRYNGQSLLDGSSDFALQETKTAATVAGTAISATAGAQGAAGANLGFTINGTTVNITLDSNGNIDKTALGAAITNANVSGVNVSTSGAGVTLTTSATGANAQIALGELTGTGNPGLLAKLGLSVSTTNGTTTKQVGSGADIIVGSSASDTILLEIASLTSANLGLTSLNVSTQTGATSAITALDSAINSVSNARADMGATMSRFEFRSAQIATSVENLDAAKSAISDVDIAKEQAKLSASKVKVQAAVAAASQANQMPENLLQLMR